MSKSHPCAHSIASYWRRWITARRLASVRKLDPDWVERHEYFASLAGTNIQLDETLRGKK